MDRLVVVTTVLLGVGMLRGLPVMLTARSGAVPLLWIAAGVVCSLAGLGVLAAAARGLGSRRVVVAAGVTLGVASVGVHVVAPGGFFHFFGIAAGVVSFVVTLAVLAAGVAGGFAPAVFLGLALDAVARSGLGSPDLMWFSGAWTVAVAAAVAAVHVVLVAMAGDVAPAARSVRTAASAFAFGPLLLVELQLLANQGWVATAAGLSDERASGAVVVGLGMAVLASGARWPAFRREPLAASAVLLVLLVSVMGLVGSRLAVGAVVVGQVAAGRFLRAAVAPSSGDRRGALPFFFAAGMAAAAMTVGAYYGVSASSSPVEGHHLLVVIGIVFVAAGAARTGRRGVEEPAVRASWSVGGVALLATAGLLGAGVVPIAPEQRGRAPSPGLPVRVATYNVHNGFSLQPRLNVPAVAAALEEAEVEVVALQEVSRGRLIDGGLDTLAWLGRRLGMPHAAFGPTSADGTVGNAVLSRHEITGVTSIPLPSSEISRGAVAVAIDAGRGQELLVVTTHLEARDRRARNRQMRALLSEVDGGEGTIVLGDLNAGADSAVIDLLRRGGFDPASDGATFPSSDPDRTLDWVAHSPDLTVRGKDALHTEASDHLPVVVTIDRSERRAR